VKPTQYQDCLDNGQARIIQVDIAKAKSLRNIAQAREQFLDQKITSQNANFIFEGLYSCVLEYLHAHLAEKGIRIENHICISYYLQDTQKDQTHRLFEDCRYKRNALLYYGEQMPEKTAKKSIQDIQTLLEQVKQLA
jgi:tRNA A37 threonylcarbamoyltransferase TsaD